MPRKESSTNTLNKIALEGNCRMSQALSLIEGRWKLNIICQLFLHSGSRFSELKEMLPLISEKMLTQQLNALIMHGIVLRETLREKPLSVVYRLSDRGRKLEGVLHELYQWGQQIG